MSKKNRRVLYFSLTNNDLLLFPQRKDDYDPEEFSESGIDYDFVRITYEIVLSLVIIKTCLLDFLIIHLVHYRGCRSKGVIIIASECVADSLNS